ncbi:MAG: cryptochrome/photolyase family protein [Myxococcota bacterium]
MDDHDDGGGDGMSAFLERLRSMNEADPAEDRRWIYVPYDQLTDRVGPLAEEAPETLGIVLVETTWKPAQRPYHKQKLAMVLASQRHFALEQAERGVAVRYVFGEDAYDALLAPVIEELGPLEMMEAAEYELRSRLAPLVEAGDVEVLPNETWLTSREQFTASIGDGKSWRMDKFYRRVRKDTGILMEGGKPEGGKYSYDADNRKAWKGDPPAPKPPCFDVDEIKAEVAELVEARFGDHPGELDLTTIPASRAEAEAVWAWAKASCLTHFGPYEDAMSTRSSGLFHTRISALMNNGRLLPRDVVDDALALDLPLSSKEGFVRQILGWREFMRHVHVETEGFRRLPKGASSNALAANEPLPDAYWGTPSGLACLDHVVTDVWRTGYGHHITRLMVLSNIATLLGLDPRELSDWFWVAYVDAYDWVVEPNVIGMGTFALGDLFVTKPYVSGAAYVNRMSDYCQSCEFSPKKDCPLTPLYWSFLERNEKALEGNVRMAMPLRSLAKRDKKRRAADRRVRAKVIDALRKGVPITPEDVA